jgi:hypothetical protein
MLKNLLNSPEAATGEHRGLFPFLSGQGRINGRVGEDAANAGSVGTVPGCTRVDKNENQNCDRSERARDVEIKIHGQTSFLFGFVIGIDLNFGVPLRAYKLRNAFRYPQFP